MQAQSSNLDSIKQINSYGAEYWSARNLMKILGYTKWENFKHIIERAEEACKNSGQIVEDHFLRTRQMINTYRGAQRPQDDYNLSRFACYLIAMNGDPRKEEIAAAQVYFAVTTRAHEIHQLRVEQEKRLEVRMKVSDSFKALASAAQGAGVMSEHFGIFVDAGYLGLHRRTKQELMELKDIPEKEDYLDNIGRQELSAIDFKNTQTEGKLIADRVDNEEDAIQTHYFVGDQVRKAIEAIGGPMPEDLPSAPSIIKLVEERRKAAKKRRLNAAKQSGQQSLLADETEESS
jgi:DNA-damage-inducible protein D